MKSLLVLFCCLFVKDGVVRASGLFDVKAGEMVKSLTKIFGMALNLEKETVVAKGSYLIFSENFNAQAHELVKLRKEVEHKECLVSALESSGAKTEKTETKESLNNFDKRKFNNFCAYYSSTNSFVHSRIDSMVLFSRLRPQIVFRGKLVIVRSVKNKGQIVTNTLKDTSQYIKEHAEFGTYISQAQSKSSTEFLGNITKYIASKNNNIPREMLLKLDIAESYYPHLKFPKKIMLDAIKPTQPGIDFSKFHLPETQYSENTNVMGIGEFIVGARLCQYKDTPFIYNILSNHHTIPRFSRQVRQATPDAFLDFGAANQCAIDIKLGNLKSGHWGHVNYAIYDKDLGFNSNMNQLRFSDYCENNSEYMHYMQKVIQNNSDKITTMQINAKIDQLLKNYRELESATDTIPLLNNRQNEMLISLYEDLYHLAIPYNANILIIDDSSQINSLEITVDPAFLRYLEKHFDPSSYFQNYHTRKIYTNFFLANLNKNSSVEITKWQGPINWAQIIALFNHGS